MNDYQFNDPQQQSFEAWLAAMAPQTSLVQQQQLLYACAFAAGQRKALGSMRRWQIVAASLGLLLLGISIPFARGQLQSVRHIPEPLVAAERTRPQPPARSTPAVVARQQAAVQLDAWQVHRSASASLAEQLTQWEQTDPHLRSLAVGTLTRALLKP